MKIPQDKIEEIANKTDILEVIGAYVALKPNGGRYWGLCPFHGEKSPSFTVSPEKNLYYCFGCKEKGGVFTFLQKIENLSFVEAVQRLADKVGVDLRVEEETPEDRQKKALTELLARVTKSFRYFLQETEEGQSAREILNKRQITHPFQEEFQLGYAPTDRRWLYGFLRKKNYSSEILSQSGLFSKNYPEVCLFSGRLIFPINSPQGATIGFGGRLLGDADGPKYLNSPDTPLFHKSQNLYGYHLGLGMMRTLKEVYLCEGYMDVISLHQAGIRNAVAPLGTSFTEDQGRLLKRTCKTLRLLLDSDEAGQKATIRAIEIGEKLEFDIRVHFLTEGKDPSEILEKSGVEALKQAIKEEKTGFDFFLDFYYDKPDVPGRGTLDNFLQNLFLFLDIIPSSVRKETYIGLAADRLKVSKTNLMADYQGRKLRGKLPVPKDVPVRQSLRETPSVEFLVLTAAAVQRDLFSLVRKELIKEDFMDHRALALFTILEKAEDAEEKSLEALLARIEDPDLKDEIIERSLQTDLSRNQEKFVSDGILRLKRRNLEKKRFDLVKELEKIPPTPENKGKIIDLLQEKKYLDSEINQIKVVYHD